MPDRAFGLLVLGSPDPTRYSADMGTEFLMRIGEVASAALSAPAACRPPEARGGPPWPAPSGPAKAGSTAA
jgi:hypothetical protein